MLQPPVGTVTFLFTDVEGSTRLLQTRRDEYPELLAAHHRLMRVALQQWRGQEGGHPGRHLFRHLLLYDAGAQLLAAAGALRERMGSSMPPVDRPEYGRTLNLVRAALTGDRFTLIWAEAAAAPDQVVTMALAGPMLALG